MLPKLETTASYKKRFQWDTDDITIHPLLMELLGTKSSSVNRKVPLRIADVAISMGLLFSLLKTDLLSMSPEWTFIRADISSLAKAYPVVLRNSKKCVHRSQLIRDRKREN